MTITVERYLKVVHPFWSKEHLKRWMIHAAMVFAWIAGILSSFPLVFVTTAVKDGMCMAYSAWKSPMEPMIVNAWYSFTYGLAPTIVFVFCYTRIVVIMRRQMRVMAAHNAQASTQTNASQIQSKRIKWNIIKTMIIVSVSL